MPLTSLSKLLQPHTTVFKQFAEQYDLVYFGKLHQEDDDQRIVHGVTVSTQHSDDHYCVGTVHGYDMVALRRTDKLQLPNSTHTESYSWVIMQFDLHSPYDNPHVFIDGNHHNEAFYQTLFIKFARLMKLDKSAMANISPAFNQRFTAYTPPDALDALPELLTTQTADTLATHFGHFDFEWFQDKVIVYSTGRAPTKHLLGHMLRAGLWLSETLDKNGQKISAHRGADTQTL